MLKRKENVFYSVDSNTVEKDIDQNVPFDLLDKMDTFRVMLEDKSYSDLDSWRTKKIWRKNDCRWTSENKSNLLTENFLVWRKVVVFFLNKIWKGRRRESSEARCFFPLHFDWRRHTFTADALRECHVFPFSFNSFTNFSLAFSARHAWASKKNIDVFLF